MFVILRFAALQPPAERRTLLTLESDSTFQQELRGAIEEVHAAERVRQIARRLVDTDFVRKADDVKHGASLLALLDRLRGARRPGGKDLAEIVRTAVEGVEPQVLAGDLRRARDSVVAAYLLADGTDGTLAQELVRAYSLVGEILSGHQDRSQLEALLRGALSLPDYLVAREKSGTAAEQLSPEVVAREMAERINTLAARHDALTETTVELDVHAEDELDLAEAGERRPLGDLYMSRHRPGPVEGPAEDVRRKPSTAAPSGNLAVSPLLRAATGRNVLMSARALEVMPATAVRTLRSLELDPASSSVADMHRSLVRARGQTGQQLMKLTGELAEYLGKAHLHTPAFLDPRFRLDPVDEFEPAPPVVIGAPTTYTKVSPLGVADLLLVRAHVSHYERSEVADVVNVLAHERLTRSVRNLDTSETTTTNESETTDLRSQTQTIAEQENGQTTVQAVGPGVGPIAAEGASSFAKNVTDQVSSSSSTRVRRLGVERRLRESEETSEHLIDNSAGQAGLYGVYQWLDKIYEARTFSYGTRLLYDVVVPEPAAMFREALARPRNGLPAPARPARFKVSPEDLSLFNWAYYATGHRASGVDAPPPERVVVTEPFGKQAKDPFASDSPTNTLTFAEARSTRLPKGYKAARYNVVILASGYGAGRVSVSVGTKTIYIEGANGNYVRSGRLDGERDTIPVALDVTSDGINWGVSDITVGVEIVCEASEELVSAWQVKAHGQILEANRRRFEEYVEAIATRDATARLVLQGLSEARKATIVHTEVKRAALAYLTGQSFAGFNAIALDAGGYPYPNAGATSALAAYIRFFEQAVEWDHLAYAFYPYFWGSQGSWVSKLLNNESDPRFAGFLSSGAARVVLPVRPGYEQAFEQFLNSGQVPTLDKLLDVGSSLWVSLANQLRANASPEGEETPVGEPWMFRVATDLVRARTDGSMPRWSLNQGVWRDGPDASF